MAIADLIEMDKNPLDMPTKQARRQSFLQDYFKDQPIQVIPLPGDASFRKYYRILGADKSYILMEDTPARRSRHSLWLNHSGILPRICAGWG